jgi:hypothetical protein
MLACWPVRLSTSTSLSLTQPRMQHRSLVSSQPPGPAAMALSRLAQRREPDIVLSRERDQIAGKVRVAQVRRFGHTLTLVTQIPATR